MNNQGFDITTPKGLQKALKFLQALIELGATTEDTDYTYNEIHLVPKNGWLDVEWESTSLSGEYGGKFIFFNEDCGDVLKKCVEHPDGSCEVVNPENVQDAIKKWEVNHPHWQKDHDGIWHDTERERKDGLSYKDLKELESKPGDDIFKVVELVPLDPTDFFEVVGAIPGDVAHRSEVIVIGPDLLAAATEALDKRDWKVEDPDDLTLFKVGEMEYDYSYKDWGMPYEAERVNHSHVYCCNDLGPTAIFLTGDTYPIGRVDVKEDDK